MPVGLAPPLKTASWLSPPTTSGPLNYRHGLLSLVVFPELSKQFAEPCGSVGRRRHQLPQLHPERFDQVRSGSAVAFIVWVHNLFLPAQGSHSLVKQSHCARDTHTAIVLKEKAAEAALSTHCKNYRGIGRGSSPGRGFGSGLFLGAWPEVSGVEGRGAGTGVGTNAESRSDWSLSPRKFCPLAGPSCAGGVATWAEAIPPEMSKTAAPNRRGLRIQIPFLYPAPQRNNIPTMEGFRTIARCRHAAHCSQKETPPKRGSFDPRQKRLIEREAQPDPWFPPERVPADW